MPGSPAQRESGQADLFRPDPWFHHWICITAGYSHLEWPMTDECGQSRWLTSPERPQRGVSDPPPRVLVAPEEIGGDRVHSGLLALQPTRVILPPRHCRRVQI